MVTPVEVKALVTIPSAALGNNDDEIDASLTSIIGNESSLYFAAALVCRRIASFYFDRVDISAGDAEIKQSQLANRWMRLAKDFEQQSRLSISNAGPIANGAVPGSIFDRQQFINTGAIRGE